MNRFCQYIIFFILFYGVSGANSQTLRGIVFSDENVPIPYVHVYVKYTNIGTVTDDKGNYFLSLGEGDYEIVFSTIGYDIKVLPIVIYNKDGDIVKNIYMEPSDIQLEQVVIQSKRRDPAYEIIQAAIKAKNDNFRMLQSSSCDVYIKAKEVISEKEKKKRERKEKQEKEDEKRKKDEEKIPLIEGDPIAIKQQEEQKKLDEKQQQDMKMAGSMNIVEIQMERHYQYPDKIKEIRSAYKARGSQEGLYFLTTAEYDFNFYSNLMDIGNLNETPMVSPLHTTSVLSYKFKLEKTWFEGESMIYHISVTPRKQGNATFTGTIDIVDKSYAIRRVNLGLKKGGLLFYDDFRIQQEFTLLNDTIWIVTRQEFDYTTKESKTNFTGNTIARYDNFKFNVDFPKRFFKNELAVTTEEAYDRDTTYWDNIRPEPLSKDEQHIIRIKDSIEGAHNKKEYLDSLDRQYNKITAGDVFMFGVGHFNRVKKRHIWVAGLVDVISPIYIGGPRIGPDFSIYKGFENRQSIYFFTHIHYGIRNEDFKGTFYASYTYNPRKLARVSINTGKVFDLIQPYESFIGYMDRANYVESTHIAFEHSMEVFNGFYLDLFLSMKEYSSIEDFKFGDVSEYFVENNMPRSFKPYQLLETGLSVRYVLFQKYLTEPKRKVVLGSKWPTIRFDYKKGIKGPFGSDVDFDYVEGSIKQEFKIGTAGTSTAKIGSGKFLNTRKMFYENYRIFPKGDAWFFSTPMQNQLMDTTIITDDLFFEAHYVHHFNGAIVNFIPLVKKLRVYTLTGLNYTWIRESQYHYMDFYFGAERTFRISRQRFRIGIYFVYGGSNNLRAKPALQFSVNHYDQREKSWDY